MENFVKEVVSVRNNKILIVDDDPFFRKLISFPLVMQGFEIEMVSNGSEALDLLKKNDYSMIILDWIMPVLSGYETLLKIDKMDSLKKNIPIVIITGKKADSIQMPHSDKFYLLDFWSKTESYSKWTKRAPFIGTKLKAS